MIAPPLVPATLHHRSGSSKTRSQYSATPAMASARDPAGVEDAVGFDGRGGGHGGSGSTAPHARFRSFADACQSNSSTMPIGRWSPWRELEHGFDDEVVPMRRGTVALCKQSASIAPHEDAYLRNVPEEVVERLERLAARDATSVAAVAVRELAEVSRPGRQPGAAGRPPRPRRRHGDARLRRPGRSRRTVIVVDASRRPVFCSTPARAAAITDEQLHVPHLIDSEVANALRRASAARRLDAGGARPRSTAWRRLA